MTAPERSIVQSSERCGVGPGRPLHDGRDIRSTARPASRDTVDVTTERGGIGAARFPSPAGKLKRWAEMTRT